LLAFKLPENQIAAEAATIVQAYNESQTAIFSFNYGP